MTREQLIGLLTERFYENFAEEASRAVLSAGAVPMLYALVTSEAADLPRAVKHKVLFRGAYVLDRIYFGDPALFGSFAESFCRTDFEACTDASARRHFTKIMAHLLLHYKPDVSSLERIAGAAAEWAVDPKAKVAVKIGAVEVLGRCRGRVGWVAESWDDIVGAVAVDATPGIRCRIRKCWSKSR